MADPQVVARLDKSVEGILRDVNGLAENVTRMTKEIVDNDTNMKSRIEGELAQRDNRIKDGETVMSNITAKILDVENKLTQFQTDIQGIPTMQQNIGAVQNLDGRILQVEQGLPGMNKRIGDIETGMAALGGLSSGDLNNVKQFA